MSTRPHPDPVPGAPESVPERLWWQERIEDQLRQPGSATQDPAAPDGSRLDELAATFGLTGFDRDLVAVLWTAAYAPDLRANLTALDPWTGQITPRLVARLFGHPPRVRLPSESALILWRMVQEHELLDASAALSLDPHLIAWLDGEPELDRALVGHGRIVHTTLELDSWPVEHTAAQLRAGMPHGLRWRLRIATDDAPAGRAFAAAVAGRLGLPVIEIETGALAGDDGRERALRVHRQAFLDRVAPLLDARDATVPLPSGLVPFPLQLVVGGTPLSATEGLHDLPVRLGLPPAAERRALWLRALPEAAAWPGEDLEELSLRYDVGPGEIGAAAAMGPKDAREAALRIREAARDDLAGLAQRLECPFRWDDLVLPGPVGERLADIAFEARERGRLWAEPEAVRLYPQGRGLVALFAGPPGTGKTMAAQVIAGELGLDLLRIDLSAVLSKWVGETAQHLQKILSARVGRRALLFFDEADALYGKRVEEVRDAQDRYANMDVSHLMVALESFEGIVLLATNLRANIDPAFIRRIRHLVEFPRPDAAARAEIWHRALAALFGPGTADALGEALPRLARIEATGAQIKNAALSAVFAARRARKAPDLALLGRMLARELAKDGGGLSARELAAALEHSR